MNIIKHLLNGAIMIYSMKPFDLYIIEICTRIKYGLNVDEDLAKRIVHKLPYNESRIESDKEMIDNLEQIQILLKGKKVLYVLPHLYDLEIETYEYRKKLQDIIKNHCKKYENTIYLDYTSMITNSYFLKDRYHFSDELFKLISEKIQTFIEKI